MLRFWASSVDVLHVMAMIVWGVGLPLLVWHRFPALSRVYAWYAAAFVVLSVASNQVLGECFLTTLARHLWEAAGSHRERVPFTVVLANTVAGVRPTTREAVLVWQAAILATSVGTLFYWHKARETKVAGAANRSRGAMLDGVEHPTFPPDASAGTAP